MHWVVLFFGDSPVLSPTIPHRTQPTLSTGQKLLSAHCCPVPTVQCCQASFHISRRSGPAGSSLSLATLLQSSHRPCPWPCAGPQSWCQQSSPWKALCLVPLFAPVPTPLAIAGLTSGASCPGLEGQMCPLLALLCNSLIPPCPAPCSLDPVYPRPRSPHPAEPATLDWQLCAQPSAESSASASAISPYTAPFPEISCLGSRMVAMPAPSGVRNRASVRELRIQEFCPYQRRHTLLFLSMGERGHTS